MNTLAKPSRTARKIAKLKDRRKLQADERKNKATARRRDGGRCRFPLCGCRALKLPPRVEVSHDQHKGMGGNPAGDRSDSAGLITLCAHRHQDGIISRHKGTLRTRYLTDAGSDGPVAWDVDSATLVRHLWTPESAIVQRIVARADDDGWIEIAREVSVGQLEPLKVWQKMTLEQLALMEL